MLRFSSLLVVAATCGAVLGACAFDDGDPWAQASFALRVGFEPEAARLDDAARLVTPGDWAIALETPTVHVDAVTLALAAAGGAAGFDPADPPPGYSLCHNGHCHADDGRLVDYADIAAELAGAAGVGAPTVVQGVDLDVPLGAAALVPLSECAGDCEVPRGEFASVTVVLRDLTVSGTAFDRRTGDRARVGAEGVSFRGLVPGPIELVVPVAGAADRGEPVRAHFDVTVAVPASLLDGIDWSAIPTTNEGAVLDGTDAAASIADAIKHGAALSVVVDR